MPIDYDLLDEGDTLNAASLNSRITSLQTGVNDLLKEDLGTQALRSEHLPSIVRISDMNPGPMKVSDAPDVITASYNNKLDVGVGGRNNVLAFGPGAGAGPGWAIIASIAGATPGPFPGASTDCNISFSPSVTVVSSTTPATGFSDTTYCTGLLVRLNVAIISKAEDVFPYARTGVAMGIVWEAEGALGTYNFLEQSETGTGSRRPSWNQANYSDLSTSALITLDDTGGTAIARISGVIACIAAEAKDLKIREWNMSIIPIFGGTL